MRAIPAAPILKDTSICDGTALTLIALSPDSVNWYNSISSTLPFNTTPSYTLPAGYATQTLYLTANNDRCVSAKVAVNITVKPNPTSPIITAIDSVCAGSSVQLIASCLLYTSRCV